MNTTARASVASRREEQVREECVRDRGLDSHVVVFFLGHSEKHSSVVSKVEIVGDLRAPGVTGQLLFESCRISLIRRRIACNVSRSDGSERLDHPS
jgi:hypothetical protein